MKYGYIIIQPPPKVNRQHASWWTRWCTPPPPPIPSAITVYFENTIVNMREAVNISETTVMRYASSHPTTAFPQRILFHDICLMAEHYDPLTHNNCDPLLGKMLGEHPEFQVCLSSPYNGSYTCSLTSNIQQRPIFSMCRVKNNPDIHQKYIFAYDDPLLTQHDIIALLRRILI